MPKVYLDEDVYSAAVRRLNYVFDEFEHVYFSVSGGKDSSVMVQVAHQVAKARGRKFSLLFIDLEAQYDATIQHVQDLIEVVADTTDEVFWACLPFSLENAVSALQPEWQCWDPASRHLWVRPMPDLPYIIREDNHTLPWFDRYVTTFEDFVVLFAEWFRVRKGASRVACGVGIRSDESFNRFRAIVSTSKVRYGDKSWTTKMHDVDGKGIEVYNFYPIFDWRVEDIWGAVSRENFLSNGVYDAMWWNGVPPRRQRICQPFGPEQRQGLDQFKAIEPDTWERLLARVNGVNFGAIYCRTALLGHLKSSKPDHLTWQAYTVFLLESLGLMAPEVLGYYYSKIKYYIRWYEVNEGISLSEFLDAAPVPRRSHPSWEQIARAVEKNDFWLSSLSFAVTKEGMELLKGIRDKYCLFDETKLTAALRKARDGLQQA